MSFGPRTVEVARAALLLAAFYVSFGVLLYAVTIVEWAAAEGLRAAGAFEPVSAWIGGLPVVLRLSVPALLAAVALYWGLVRVFHRPPASWGWPTRAARRVMEGTAWGVALAALTLVLCVVGGARIAGQAGSAGAYLAVALPVLAGLVLAALLEELLFRGFPLTRLAAAAGRAGAAVTLAVVFGLMHAWNPQLSLLGVVNIGLASLVLSAVFFAGGGLAGAWGLHTGWNAGLALGADAPVSGLSFGLPAVAYDPGPREWLTGGGFGPEGGLAATLVLAAVTVWWGRRALALEAAA